MVKLLVQQKVPVYWYVMNTTVEAFKLPEWRKVPHDTEHFFLCGAPFMDTEFFPKRLRLERNMWTDNDRNMSHFFMKTYADFARYGNPTPQQVLGLHFDMARDGELKYLNLNTTYNSSILLNYRQTESAFWTQVNSGIVYIRFGCLCYSEQRLDGNQCEGNFFISKFSLLLFCCCSCSICQQ